MSPREGTARILAGFAALALAAAPPAVLGCGEAGGEAEEGAPAARSATPPSAPAPAPGTASAPPREPGASGSDTATGRPPEPGAARSGEGREAGGEPSPGAARDSGAGRDSGAEPSAAAEPDAGAEPAASEAGTGATTGGPDVERILARAERAYASLGSLRAAFHQEIDVPLMNRRREGHGTWYQKGRGRFMMDFREPPEDVIVADGTHLWLHYPSTNPKQVIRADLGSDATNAGTADVLARILEEARTAYDAEYVGREAVEGVPTHLLSLVPRGDSPYRRVRVWIGADDDLVRRFEITERNETVRTVTLRDLEPDVTLPDSLFRFEPPEDADVFIR